jgi:hypothetical protein
MFANCQVAFSESKLSFNVEMLPWEKVNKVLPKYSKFTVIDMETGKQFRVQRRAGSHHADVQPLTNKDTKIMKEIYGGKWSWKRRAIIVMNKDLWIAASMHGMPHGAGALQNNFPGHFCIHFYGSTTHRTNFMDLSHKIMILKAAGKLDEYLRTPDPYEVVSAYITGFKQQDVGITSLTSIQKVNWSTVLPAIDNVKINQMSILPFDDLTEELSLSVPIEIEWYIKEKGRRLVSCEIHLYRFSPHEAWKVDSVNFLKDNHLSLK